MRHLSGGYFWGRVLVRAVSLGMWTRSLLLLSRDVMARLLARRVDLRRLWLYLWFEGGDAGL